VFYHYGAKHRLAREYPAPRHGLLVEPFAGAAGYSCFWLEKRSDLRALLVEKNPRIVELWRRLLDMKPEQILEMEIPEEGSRTSDLFWILAQASNTSLTAKSAKVTARLLPEMERQRRRVARVVGACGDRFTVELRDGVEVMEQMREERVTFFVDPPYKPRPRTAKTARPGGKGYAPGCCGQDVDFQRLADVCRQARGQVIVCEYSDADWLPFSPLKANRASVGRTYQEGLWTNEGTW